MKKSNHYQIRELLRKHEDGLTISQMEKILETRGDNLRSALKSMVDAYIDRWVFSYNKYAAVWCVLIPPENCPKPERKRK
jgi:hypothetical protein